MSDESWLLFDVPGPRARRRIRIATGVSLLLIAALLALTLRQFADHGQLAADQWALFAQWPIIRFLLTGIGQTLLVTGVAAAIAFPLGAVVALARLSRSRWVRGPARLYAELFRAVPLLLLLYIFLLALPRAGLTFPIFWQLVLPVALSNAAVVAEIFRAGVLAQERGQLEAAQSLGMTYWQAMRAVVVPQAVRKLLPALVSQLVRLLKDSTLGYVVSYLELLHKAQVLGEYYHNVLPSYLVAAACFILINGALSRTANWLEQRQRRP
ncbi:glutamate transport system permease protein [Kitasatospora sp. MAP12-15]|uniref:amino acid ABC transporter permease n=1 Tax=unclassified Kitasatospora TaxID=2633591 RepID=UPI002476A475|nr:amino acid ABC transporter permease [Kitasatospora sp. MAP12-44]MDH6109635.1 glutamate transport system permease protein [Kitasatospora sp. MAP12-44]